MIVRSATLADIPTVLAIERQSPMAAHWSHEQYEKAVESLLIQRHFFVVEEGGRPGGFLVASEVEGIMEIENIVVAKHLARQGVATGLMNELLRIARQNATKCVRLEVRESNLGARAFYSHFGFWEEGRRACYYQNPTESAILYSFIL